MLEKFTTLRIDQTFSSLLSSCGAIVFKIFLQKPLRLRGFAALVLSMNAMQA